MKLFFDARYIRTDYHDGISRYSAELGAALARLTEVTFIIHSEAQLKKLPKGAAFIKIHAPTSAKEPFTARILNAYKPDVVFSPMQTLGPRGKQFKLILTIHDFIYYHHRTPPRDLPLLIRFGWRLYHLTYAPQRTLLNGADMVATVSETTAQEIAARHLTKRPVVVVPNAPQHFTDTPVTHERSIKNLVYMGSFMGYKNVVTLIEAMAWLPGRTLHLLSRITPSRRAALSAHIPQGARVVFHNGVSDAQYQELLANNAVLVTASLDEGYGIPVAEALAMGVPAVISDIPIFHEIAGQGAQYFSPKDPQACAVAVASLDEPLERETLIQKGKAHIRRYNWDASAKTLLDAIRSL